MPSSSTSNAFKNRIFRFTVCVAGVALFAVTIGAGERETIGRFLLSDAEKIQQVKLPTDTRPLCAGPRRRDDQDSTRAPFYESARYGLEFGVGNQDGQTNNLILEFVNAVDLALDSGSLTVVYITGWATEFLEEYFIGRDPESWDQFSRDFPIISKEYSPIAETSRLGNSLIKETTGNLLLRYLPSTAWRSSWDVCHTRRISLLRYLFSGLEGEPCDFLTQIQDYLQERFNQKKYIAVHVRDLDGTCEDHTVNKFNTEICAMSPSYVKNILEANGHTGMPIVIMTDMHDEAKVHKLQDELENVVVPQWDFGANQSIIADVVMGASSEVFIGVQGSSASRHVGILREGFGRNVTTNYVYMTKTEEGNWKSFYPQHAYRWIEEVDH